MALGTYLRSKKLQNLVASGMPLKEIFLEHNTVLATMNPHFKKFTAENSWNRFFDKKKYPTTASSHYRNAVRAHIAEHKTPLTAKHVVAAMHAFYLHARKNVTSTRNDQLHMESAEYISRMFSFLEENKDSPDVQVVAFDSWYGYSGATSLLLEQGFIDDVLITHEGWGNVLDETDLRIFEGKKVSYMGCYEHDCIAYSKEQVKNVTNNKQVFDIPELIVRGLKTPTLLYYV